MVCDCEAFEETKLRVPVGLSEIFTQSLKAEHIDAFSTGNAFSMKIGQFNP